MTQNEQQLLDVAAKIATAVEGIVEMKTSLEVKITTLRTQAQSPTAFEVEDLSQEFEVLDNAVTSLENLASGIKVESVETPAPDALAGESGATNPTPEGEADLSTEPAPPGNSEAVVSEPEVAAPTNPQEGVEGIGTVADEAPVETVETPTEAPVETSTEEVSEEEVSITSEDVGSVEEVLGSGAVSATATEETQQPAAPEGETGDGDPVV